MAQWLGARLEIEGTDPEGVQGVRIPPEKSQKYRKKAIKPAFSVGPSSAHQQNTIEMALCWWADDSPLVMVFGIWIISSSKKKHCQRQSDKTLWIHAWRGRWFKTHQRHRVEPVLSRG